MNKIKLYFAKEPALIIGAIAALIIVIIESLPFFIPGIETEQVNAMLRIVQSVVALASVVFIRSQVYAPATVAHLEAMAQEQIQ